MNRCLYLLVLFLLSCGGNKTEIRKLALLSSVSEFSDTLFLADVRDLTEWKGNIYFIDQYCGRIMSVKGEDWTLNGVIGTRGEGPNELCNLSRIVLRKDTLYALDGGCGRLITYDLTGNIYNRYQLPLDGEFMLGGRFMLADGGKMNISTRSASGAFAELDLDSDKLSFWGERFSFDYTSQEIIRNGRNLFDVKDGYIAVSDNMARIEKYDNQRELIEVYDYSTLSTVRGRLFVYQESEFRFKQLWCGL